MVPAHDLVGRAGVLSRIVLELTGGRSVLLAAPRREGKSSIAREVLRQLAEDHGWLTASLDFFRLTSKRECADELVRQLLESSHSLSSRVKRFAGAAKGVMSGLEPHFTIAEMEFGLHFGPRQVDEEHAFRNALQLPEKLAEKEGKHVLVFMDEFQDAGKNLGPNVYKVMRSYFQEQPNTKHLFAGSHQSVIRALFGRGNAALLRYATEVPLEAIPASEWVDYIVRKFEQIEVSCSPILASQLVEATGGHPADTMVACDQLTTTLREHSSKEVTADSLAFAMTRTHAALRLIFDEIWSELGTIAYARLVAHRLAFGLPLSTGLRPVQATRAIAAVADKGLVMRQGGKWVFREPLFRDYIRNLGPQPSAAAP